jgi:hypothetical protein
MVVTFERPMIEVVTIPETTVVDASAADPSALQGAAK